MPAFCIQKYTVQNLYTLEQQCLIKLLHLHKNYGIINEKRTNYIKITPPEVGGAFYYCISIILFLISSLCSFSFFNLLSVMFGVLP